MPVAGDYLNRPFLSRASKKPEIRRNLTSDIETEIESMGGLEAYQNMSSIGQGKDRGGGSETVLIGWMKELGMHK